jgi:flagella basal body P-ring formation protein FlgA
MKALILIAALAGTAHAERLAAVVEARIASALPPGLGVVKVHMSATLAGIDIEPAKVAVEAPRMVRSGRASFKVAIGGRAPTYVPVTIGKVIDIAIAQHALRAGAVIGDDDVIVEHRAVETAAPAPAGSLVGATLVNSVGAGQPVTARDVVLAAPLARGTQVALEIQRGAVRIKGSGTLEMAARFGEPATVRLAQTHTVVRGTLRAPNIVVVGENP